MVKCLTQNAQLYESHRNLEAFRNGCGSQELQLGPVRRWLLSIIFTCLAEFEVAYYEDSSTLIELVLGQEKDSLSQL